MKIASQPIASIRPYVKDQAVPKEASNQNNNLPLGGSVFRVNSSNATPSYSKKITRVDHQQVAETVLRFVSSRIAEHLGPKAVLAKNAIWFCFDLKKLHDTVGDSTTDNKENMLRGTLLMGDLLNAIAPIPHLLGAEGLATGFYFIADVGDKAYHGSGSFDVDDLMKFVPLNAEDNAYVEFKEMANELLQKLNPA